MFLNRWLFRHEIVELNDLKPDEEASVFASLQPFQGEGQKARYLESDADEVIGSVRRLRVGRVWARPHRALGLSVDAEEGRNVPACWADTVQKNMETSDSSAAKPLLVDEKTAAQMLGVSRRTVFDLNEEGSLRAVRIGTRKLYLVDAIERFARGEVV
jgi:excisionase family DNA binding protein